MNLKRILVPIDFSENSMPALDAGVELAKLAGGRVSVLNVLPPIAMIEMGPIIVPPIPNARESVEDELARVLAKVPPELAGEALVDEGYPWTRICDAAIEKNFDIIVITSHGRTGLKRMLLGSTAEQVVRHSQCPVLVVKCAVAVP